MNEERAYSPPAAPPVILVVEDDVLVRIGAAEDLRDEGYEVIEAANADEALALLEAGVDVDVVLSDVNMPGRLDGPALLEIVRDRYPRIVRLLTSGLARPGAYVPQTAAGFLPKPYTRADLVGLVDRHLRQDSGA